MSSQTSGAVLAAAEGIISAAASSGAIQTAARAAGSAVVTATPLQLAKRQMRTQIKSALAALSLATIDAESRAIAEHVIAHPSYKRARAICIFMSMEKEVQTTAILAHALADGKHCFVPRILDGNHMLMLRVLPSSSSASSASSVVIGGDFELNSWGIPEPPLPHYWTAHATALACCDPTQPAATCSQSLAACSQSLAGPLQSEVGSVLYSTESLASALSAAFAEMKLKAEEEEEEDAATTEAHSRLATNTTTAAAGGAGSSGSSVVSDATTGSLVTEGKETGVCIGAQKWWRAEARDVNSITNTSTNTNTDYSAAAAPPIDLVLLPGVAFDRARQRIGYGRGYFDRYVASLNAAHKHCSAVVPPPPVPVLWGLGLRAQLVGTVPVDEAKDVPLDAICTPDGFI